MSLVTPEEITDEAYDILFRGAESYAEDWMDEDGEYSEEDADKIFERMFELLRELREKYVYAS
jgi:hypothetical protein